MGKLTFKPQVSFATPTLKGLGLYGVHLPKGLSAGEAPTPIYVSPEQMMKLQRLDPNFGRSGKGLGIVHGLTTAEFALGFADMKAQWVNQSSDAARPSWRFQGGEVYLDVKISVYLQEGDRPGNDRISRQIFGVIVEHELLHVLDDVDIASNWLPEAAARDDMVRKYLIDARPADDGMYRNWFQGEKFLAWIRDGLWIPERNARGLKRDAPAEYAALSDKINTLRSRQ